MKKYIYPDSGDELTCLFISSNSDEKYWADSEKNILNIIINRILKLSSKPNFLDLGCGLGRLFPVFYPYVNSITGLEPDFQRFTEAKNKANLIDSDKIIVINDSISCIKEEKFEAVIVSHIFQHIPFESTCDILKRLSNIIPSNGLLFVTTTFSDTFNDVFTLEYLKNNKHFSEVVSEKDFLKRFNDKGILPVRKFSPGTLKQLFKDNYFEVETMFAYHFDINYMDNEPSVEFDKLMNSTGNFKNAKDVLYILRRI